MGLAYGTLDEATRTQIEGVQAEQVYQASHRERKLVGLTASNACSTWRTRRTSRQSNNKNPAKKKF
jgi:hypothetical protein